VQVGLIDEARARGDVGGGGPADAERRVRLPVAVEALDGKSAVVGSVLQPEEQPLAIWLGGDVDR
jgi:hypothetical protein